jgi:hypothetical protein
MNNLNKIKNFLKKIFTVYNPDSYKSIIIDIITLLTVFVDLFLVPVNFSFSDIDSF